MSEATAQTAGQAPSIAFTEADQLTLEAPVGAEWSLEEVRTKRGTQSLGDVPILIWKDHDAAIQFFGEEAILNILDGTSLRVSYQSIARRMRETSKTLDEIAQAQINFRPGKRAAGASTPVSRAKRAAAAAAEKVGGDVLAQLLNKLASGDLDQEKLAALGISIDEAPQSQG